MIVCIIASHLVRKRVEKCVRSIESALMTCDRVIVSMSFDLHDSRLEDIIPDHLLHHKRIAWNKCEYLQVSQCTHWVYSTFLLQEQDHVVCLLDDDDVFCKDARCTIDKLLKSKLFMEKGVLLDSDVSGSLFKTECFQSMVKQYMIQQEDPTFPMADVSMLDDRTMTRHHKAIVIRSDRDPSTSVWYNYITNKTSREGVSEAF